MTPEQMCSSLTFLVTASIGRAFADWEEEVGRAPALRAGGATLLHGSEELGPVWMKEPMVHVTTRLEGELEGPLELYFSVEVALRLVQGPQSAGAEPRAAGELLDDAQLEAFRERMLQMCCSFNSIYTRYGLCVSDRPDQLELEQLTVDEATGLNGYAVMLPFEFAGSKQHAEVLQVMPVPLARAVALYLLGLEAA